MGWGIQSFTLAAMAAVGEIAADVAIHADTTWEKPATYEFSQKWSAWLRDRALPLVELGDPAQALDALQQLRDRGLLVVDVVGVEVGGDPARAWVGVG